MTYNVMSCGIVQFDFIVTFIEDNFNKVKWFPISIVFFNSKLPIVQRCRVLSEEVFYRNRNADKILTFNSVTAYWKCQCLYAVAMWRSFDLELAFRWASASNIYTRSLTPHPTPAARAQQEMELVDTKTSEDVIYFIYTVYSIP